MAINQCCTMLCLQKFFAIWAGIVTKCTFLTMIVSLALLAFAGKGYFDNYKEFEDESTVWTPEGNLSVVSRNRAEKLFGSVKDQRFISFIFEAKGDTLLTRDSLEEMAAFERDLFVA